MASQCRSRGALLGCTIVLLFCSLEGSPFPSSTTTTTMMMVWNFQRSCQQVDSPKTNQEFHGHLCFYFIILKVVIVAFILFSNTNCCWHNTNQPVGHALNLLGAGAVTAASLLQNWTDGYQFYKDGVCEQPPPPTFVLF